MGVEGRLARAGVRTEDFCVGPGEEVVRLMWGGEA